MVRKFRERERSQSKEFERGKFWAHEDFERGKFSFREIFLGRKFESEEIRVEKSL